MDSEEPVGADLNISSTHLDFVVGSEQLEVCGVTREGDEERRIAAGEWVFDL